MDDFLADRYLWDAIYHVFFGEAIVAEFFVNKIDKEKLCKNIKVFYEIEPENDANFYARYFIDCILGLHDKIDKERKKKYGKELTFNYMKRAKDQVIQGLLPYITKSKKPENITNKEAHNLSFFLLLLRDTYPGAFETFYEELYPLIKEIGNERLSLALGPMFFSLLKKPPQKSFFENYQIDINSIPDLFKSALIMTSSEACNELQRKITNMFQYPNKFPYIADDVFTCVNTVISTNSTFTDLLKQLFIEYLASGDYDLIIQNMKPFLMIVPYFIIGHYDFVSANIHEVSSLLLQKYPPSAAAGLVLRIRNDAKLLELVSFLTGQENSLTPADLYDKSIVYYLQYTLGNPEILNYASLKYYMITDKTAETDFDFIRMYSVFRIFFSVFNNPQTHAKKILDNMNEYLVSIKNKENREKIALDLFSLIFLKNKKNQFIFTTFLAKILLRMIAPLTTNKYVQNANTLIQKTPFWQKDPPFISFFTRDPSDIFEAIRTKNWQTANELTSCIPYYRKIYILAHSVDAFINENDVTHVPEEAQKHISQVKLEVSLSTFPNNLIESMREQHKEYEQLLEKRSEGNPIDALQSTKWSPVSKYVDSFYNAIDLDPYLETIKVSPKLHDFSSYLNEYRHMTNTNKFDFIGALENAFNHGRVDYATKLASMCNKDLMEIILNNRGRFYITTDFIKDKYKKYPLEMIALAVTEVDPIIINQFDGINDCLRKFVSPNNMQAAKKTQQQKLNKLMKMVESDECDVSAIDDIVYTIPARDIIEKLLEKESFNSASIKLLSLVDYEATEEERGKILDIILKYTLTIEKGSSIDITRKLLAKSKSLAIRYMKSLSFEEAEDAIVDAFSRMSEEPLFISKLVSEFQEHFLNLLAKFGRTEKFIPLFLHDCPEGQRNILEAFVNLPQVIYTNCENLDSDEVIRVLLEHRDAIFQLTDVQKPILNDERLMKLVKTFSTPIQVFKAISFLKPFFEDTRMLEEYTKEFVAKLIRTINVDSIEAEDKSRQTVLLAVKIWNIFGDSEKLLILRRLVEYSPFIRFGFTYNFSSFGTEEFGEYLVSACLKADLTEMAAVVCKAYDTPSDYLTAHTAFKQFILNLFSDAKKNDFSQTFRIEKFRVKGWGENTKPFYDGTLHFISPILKISSFPATMLQRIIKADLSDITKNPMKYKASIWNYTNETVAVLLELSKGIRNAQITSKSENDKLNQQRATHAQFFIQRHCELPNAISILVSIGNYSAAYQSLWRIDSEREREEAFIHQFFLPGIAEENSRNFIAFIKSQDPTLQLTSSLWDHLQELMQKKGCIQGLVFVYEFRNYLEDMALNALSLFTTAKTLNDKYVLIGKTFAALDNARRCRSGEMTLTPPFKASNISTEELNETFELVSLQLRFCQFCFESGKVACTDDMDLIHNPDSAALMAASLMLDGNENQLYESICEITNVSHNEVVAKAVDILCERQPLDSLNYLSGLKKKNYDLSIELMIKVIKQLSLGPMFMFIPQFITLEDDLRKRAMLFIDFDFLPHAYEIIFENKFDDLMPFVGYRASQTGNSMTLLNFTK